MRRAAILVAVGFGCGIAVAANAASPYDGRWLGTAPEAGDCGVLTVNITVIDGKVVAGTVSGRHASPPIDWGFVRPDGFGKIQYSTQPTLTAILTFSGNQFTGLFPTHCGKRPVSGSRTP
jgi:hypothetical protein